MSEPTTQEGKVPENAQEASAFWLRDMIATINAENDAKTAALQAELERVTRERDVLAEAIGEAVIKAGVCRPDVGDLDGPQLLLLLDSLADASVSTEQQLSELRAELAGAHDRIEGLLSDHAAEKYRADTVEQQLSELRAEMETVRAERDDARREIRTAREAWRNQCHKTVPEALRFLANNDRPIGGEQRFNAWHLFQLADEIEFAARSTFREGIR